MSEVCREDLRLKGAAYPRSCPACNFGPCKNGHDYGKPAPKAEPLTHDQKVETLARIISPIDWEAKDKMSEEDFKFSGLCVNASLRKAMDILFLVGKWK